MRLDDIQSVTKSVTAKWTKQRKKEERQSRSRSHRSEYIRMYTMPFTEAAEDVIPKAYAKVSGPRKLSAHARQIFYAARPAMEEMTGKILNSEYFTQTLLPDYVRDHDLSEVWKLVYDARGHLEEPHTGETVPLGTIDVDNYLRDIRSHVVSDPDSKQLNVDYPTKGPAHRYSAILFIEKEGFHPLFKEVKLAERYDLAIMSTKGQSVVAARKLVDELCPAGGNVPVLVLHDFDIYGLGIFQTLVSVSDAAYIADRIRYEFQNEINFIDLGLRLEDVKKYGLASERVKPKKWPDGLEASDEEKEFLLSGRRVELNAFTSPDFISWIESKLAEHGIKKVIPDEDTLMEAYCRAYQICEINRRIELIADEAKQIAEDAEIPRKLRKQIEMKLRKIPEQPWDKVLAEIARERCDDSA
jgi:hypothetical protein